MGQTQSGKRVGDFQIPPFGKLMAALTTMKRREAFSEFDADVYESTLAHIPLPILSRAVQQWLTTETWFPTVAELLQTCEAVRVELRAALKFEPCEQCSSDGWTEQEFHGIKRMVRCACWKAHQQKVAALGVPSEPLALPAGRTSELTRIGEGE